MLMIEVRPPFQWRPSFVHFGDFRRVMWMYVAITYVRYDINELIEGIASVAVKIANDGKSYSACDMSSRSLDSGTQNERSARDEQE